MPHLAAVSEFCGFWAQTRYKDILITRKLEKTKSIVTQGIQGPQGTQSVHGTQGNVGDEVFGWTQWS